MSVSPVSSCKRKRGKVATDRAVSYIPFSGEPLRQSEPSLDEAPNLNVSQNIDPYHRIALYQKNKWTEIFDPKAVTTTASTLIGQFPVIRLVELREGKILSHLPHSSSRQHQLGAAVLYERGVVRTGRDACDLCRVAYRGVFKECVALDGFYNGSCANCKYRGRHSNCSLARGQVESEGVLRSVENGVDLSANMDEGEGENMPEEARVRSGDENTNAVELDQSTTTHSFQALEESWKLLDMNGLVIAQLEMNVAFSDKVVAQLKQATAAVMKTRVSKKGASQLKYAPVRLEGEWAESFEKFDSWKNFDLSVEDTIDLQKLLNSILAKLMVTQVEQSDARMEHLDAQVKQYRAAVEKIQTGVELFAAI